MTKRVGVSLRGQQETVFTFAILPRYNDRQLKLYKAKKLGSLTLEVAEEVLAFAKTVKTLNSGDRKLVVEGLTAIIASLTATNTPWSIAAEDLGVPAR
jgi:hypothetical protein